MQPFVTTSSIRNAQQDDDDEDETPLLDSDGLEMETMGKGSARLHQSPIEDNTSWTSDVPDNCTAVGIPARIIRHEASNEIS